MGSPSQKVAQRVSDVFSLEDGMKNIARALALLVVTAAPAYAGVQTTTPEPATITLVATGAAVVGVAAWIRRRKK
jgi:PEP-CTERM motif